MPYLCPLPYEMNHLFPESLDNKVLALWCNDDHSPMRFCMANRHQGGGFSVTYSEARSLTSIESLVLVHRFLHVKTNRFRGIQADGSTPSLSSAEACPETSAVKIVADLCKIAAKQTPYAYLIAAHFFAQRGQNERLIVEYLNKFAESEQQVTGVDVNNAATQEAPANASAAPPAQASSSIFTRNLTQSEVDCPFGLAPVRKWLKHNMPHCVSDVDEIQKSFVDLKAWAIANQARLRLGYKTCLEPRNAVATQTDEWLQKDAESADSNVALPALDELALRASDVASAFMFTMRARIIRMNQVAQAGSASSSSSSTASQQKQIPSSDALIRQMRTHFVVPTRMFLNGANPPEEPSVVDKPRLSPLLQADMFEAHFVLLRQYLRNKPVSDADPSYERKFLFCYGTLYALIQYLHVHWPRKQDRNGSIQSSLWQRWVAAPNQKNRQKDFLELLSLLREPRDPENFGEYIENSGKSKDFTATSYGITRGSEEYQNARRFLVVAMKQCDNKIFYEALALFFKTMTERVNERDTVEYVLKRDHPEFWSMAFPANNAASNQFS